MKRIIISFVFVLCILVMASGVNAATIIDASEFDTVVAGQICRKDKPILSEGHTWLLPLRQTCEKLGISNENIKWHTEIKKAVLQDKTGFISVTVGDDTVFVNDEAVTVERPALLYNGTLYLPLGFYENALQCKVTWDNANGIIYIQRKENYDLIYNFLKHARVADTIRDNELVYEYVSYAQIEDAETGYKLSSQERSGVAEYSLKTGECRNKGAYTRLGRTFQFENHYINNILYKTEFSKTVKTSKKEEIDSFIKSTLGNAFLSREKGKNVITPIVSDEMQGYSSMSELEKLALVLSVSEEKDEKAVEISGSTLGIITPLNQSAIVDEEVSYKIDTASGRLLKASKSSIALEKVYGIDVKVLTGWSCKYKVE